MKNKSIENELAEELILAKMVLKRLESRGLDSDMSTAIDELQLIRKQASEVLEVLRQRKRDRLVKAFADEVKKHISEGCGGAGVQLVIDFEEAYEQT